MPRAGSEAKGSSVEEQVRMRLEQLRKEFGEVPLVPQELSAFPDLFLPYASLSDRVLLNPEYMDKKSVELACIAAGSALASEHCLNVHIKQALKFGATKSEVMEAAMVGAFMAMTASQSVAFRKIRESE
jgi:AhpD family alkylhydroperoxidase